MGDPSPLKSKAFSKLRKSIIKLAHVRNPKNKDEKDRNAGDENVDLAENEVRTDEEDFEFRQIESGARFDAVAYASLGVPKESDLFSPAEDSKPHKESKFSIIRKSLDISHHHHRTDSDLHKSPTKSKTPPRRDIEPDTPSPPHKLSPNQTHSVHSPHHDSTDELSVTPDSPHHLPSTPPSRPVDSPFAEFLNPLQGAPLPVFKDHETTHGNHNDSHPVSFRNPRFSFLHHSANAASVTHATDIMLKLAQRSRTTLAVPPSILSLGQDEENNGVGGIANNHHHHNGDILGVSDHHNPLLSTDIFDRRKTVTERDVIESLRSLSRELGGSESGGTAIGGEVKVAGSIPRFSVNFGLRRQALERALVHHQESRYDSDAEESSRPSTPTSTTDSAVPSPRSVYLRSQQLHSEQLQADPPPPPSNSQDVSRTRTPEPETQPELEIPEISGTFVQPYSEEVQLQVEESGDVQCPQEIENENASEKMGEQSGQEIIIGTSSSWGQEGTEQENSINTLSQELSPEIQNENVESEENVIVDSQPLISVTCPPPAVDHFQPPTTSDETAISTLQQQTTTTEPPQSDYQLPESYMTGDLNEFSLEKLRQDIVLHDREGDLPPQTLHIRTESMDKRRSRRMSRFMEAHCEILEKALLRSSVLTPPTVDQPTTVGDFDQPPTDISSSQDPLSPSHRTIRFQEEADSPSKPSITLSLPPAQQDEHSGADNSPSSPAAGSRRSRTYSTMMTNRMSMLSGMSFQPGAMPPKPRRSESQEDGEGGEKEEEQKNDDVVVATDESQAKSVSLGAQHSNRPARAKRRMGSVKVDLSSLNGEGDSW